MKLKKIYAILTALLIVLFATAFNLQGQTLKQETVTTNAVDALLVIVKTYHRPIIGEFVSPVPSGILLNVDARRSERELLNSLIAQCPGYFWSEQSGVIVFGNERLMSAPGNPMNNRLKSYTIPSNLNEFKATFPGAVTSQKHPKEEMGGFVSGIALADDLSPKLTVEQVKDMKARTVLVKVAEQIGIFLSAIVLPPKSLYIENKNGEDFLAWDVVGGPGIDRYKSYLSQNP